MLDDIPQPELLVLALVSGRREACRLLGRVGGGERTSGKEERRGQGGARMELKRQKLPLFY